MVEDYTKTKYFKYLLNNHKEIDRERISFNKEILELLNRKVDELGTILKCHLILEFYIDKYLEAAYPTVTNWQNSRLTFAQKLEIINNSKTPIGMYYSSIKCLNSLRNKFSHKISYKVEDKDYKEITEIMTCWYDALGDPVLKGMELIENFTIWVCGSINGMINGINKETKNFGLPAYLHWLENMQQPDE